MPPCSVLQTLPLLPPSPITTNKREKNVPSRVPLQGPLFGLLPVSACPGIWGDSGMIYLISTVHHEASPDWWQHLWRGRLLSGWDGIEMDVTPHCQAARDGCVHLGFHLQQTDMRGVFRRLINGLTNLGKTISFLALRNRMLSPNHSGNWCCWWFCCSAGGSASSSDFRCWSVRDQGQPGGGSLVFAVLLTVFWILLTLSARTLLRGHNSVFLIFVREIKSLYLWRFY